MAKFLSFQQTAAALIAKAGSKVTLTRTSVLGFDPITDADLTQVQSEDFIAVAMPPSQQAKYQAQTLERNISYEVYFSLKGRTMRPEPGDLLRLNGDEHKVFWATTYDPALDGPIFTLAYVSQ